MEIKNKKNIVIIKKKIASNETYKVIKSGNYTTITFMKKPQILVGIASCTADNKDVLFVDYDDVDLDVILRDYDFIQKKFVLPAGYLLKTSKGYHVICLAKLKPSSVFDILKYTHCDSAYTSMPLRNKYRNWILRVSTKNKKHRPKFLRLIGDIDYGLNQPSSRAHKEFLDACYKNIKHPDYKNLDKLTKVALQRYEAF